jgi:hypothetical protein
MISARNFKGRKARFYQIKKLIVNTIKSFGINAGDFIG